VAIRVSLLDMVRWIDDKDVESPRRQYVLPTMKSNGVAHVVLLASSCKVLALPSGRCAKNQSSFGANNEALLRSHNFDMLFRLDWH
jgi:hypothetical protein